MASKQYWPQYSDRHVIGKPRLHHDTACLLSGHTMMMHYRSIDRLDDTASIQFQVSYSDTHMHAAGPLNAGVLQAGQTIVLKLWETFLCGHLSIS